MLPPAPGRLSMVTGWPRRSPSFGAMIRTVASVDPPGGNVTITRIGFAGQAASGWAGAALAATSAAAVKARMNWGMAMSSGRSRWRRPARSDSDRFVNPNRDGRTLRARAVEGAHLDDT